MLSIRKRVKRFVDGVFTATVDDTPAKDAMEGGKKATAVKPGLMQDVE